MPSGSNGKIKDNSNNLNNWHLRFVDLTLSR